MNTSIYRNAKGIGVVDASDLGLRPGFWPLVLEIDGSIHQQKSRSYRGGELASVRYENRDSAVDVYND